MDRIIKLLPFFGLLLLYIASLFIDVMDVDSSQYAAMAMEMVQNNSFLEITDQGRNYLDKPPLLFWLSAFSYKLFGMSNWAFKLPSMLFALLGIFSTYRFSKLYYKEKVAYWAALMVGTTQAFFLMVNDVRTDLMLTGAVIFAVWQIAAYIEGKRWQNFVLGFVGIGLAMLAKGPIGLVLPIAGFGIHILLQRDWKTLFKWQWLLGLVIIGIVLLPMMIGLYTQYDSNPTVEVNGGVGASGLKFYFWTQSFGRITGENVWNNNAGPFFLTESTLWAFLPWTVLLFCGWVGGWFSIIKSKLKIEKEQEAITLGAFTFALFALSKSSYQLPHYIFVAYPFAAIFTAKWAICVLEEGYTWAKNTLKITQIVISVCIWVAATALFFVFDPTTVVLPAILALGVLTAIVYLVKNYKKTTSVLQVSVISIFLFNMVMSLHFYKQLLPYQAFNVGGKYMAEKTKTGVIAKENFIVFPFGSAHSLDFYTGWIVRNVWTEQYFSHFKNGDEIWVYTNQKGRSRLKKLPYEITDELYMPHYKPAELRIQFLNPATRDSTLRHHYILKVKIQHQDSVDFSLYPTQVKF